MSHARDQPPQAPRVVRTPRLERPHSRSHSLNPLSFGLPARPWSSTGTARMYAVPPLTPNTIKAILQHTALDVAGFDLLTQGAGALNGEGAVRLAAAIDTKAPAGTGWADTTAAPATSLIGDATYDWAQRLVWGERLVWGGSPGLGGRPRLGRPSGMGRPPRLGRHDGHPVAAVSPGPHLEHCDDSPRPADEQGGQGGSGGVFGTRKTLPTPLRSAAFWFCAAGLHASVVRYVLRFWRCPERWRFTPLQAVSRQLLKPATFSHGSAIVSAAPPLFRGERRHARPSPLRQPPSPTTLESVT
jgi:hypothetical protein